MRTLLLVLFLSLYVSSASSNIKVGSQFPRFDLKSLDGKSSMKLSDHKEGFLLIDFWASWCAPCKEALPFYDEVLKKLAKIENKKAEVKVIGINVDDVPSAGLDFLKSHPTGFVHYFDQDMQLLGKTGATIMPTSYLLDSKGKILEIKVGFRSKDKAKIEKKLIKMVKTGLFE